MGENDSMIIKDHQHDLVDQPPVPLENDFHHEQTWVTYFSTLINALCQKTASEIEVLLLGCCSNDENFEIPQEQQATDPESEPQILI